MQSAQDKLSRLKLMASDKGQTWDLSGNDHEAIQFALDRIAELESQIEALRRQYIGIRVAID